MTFIVNQDGVVFQKDLGEDTATAVESIQAFDPDSSWTAVAPPKRRRRLSPAPRRLPAVAQRPRRADARPGLDSAADWSR